MKLINSHCFTATNTVRSAATITVLVLCLSVARGESLTTLDGKTYTNISDISKYTKQVFFTCSSNRIGVAITNLPEEFRAKNGIKILTNAPPLLAAETNSIDFFLKLHSNSALTVETETNQLIGIEFRSWTIKVTAKGFELWTGTVIDDESHPENHLNIQQSADFKFNQEIFVVAALNKTVEWGKIASEKKAEAFEKVIGSLPDEILGNIGEKNDYIFYWSTDRYIAGYGLKGSGFVFNQEDVSRLIGLMHSLPSLKQQLAEKIKSQESQQMLFK